jgi:hypothetical protein
MAAPTLTQVFGANASQTSTTITINKADLAAVGLTASANNTADSLLAAIIAQAETALADTNVATNTGQTIGISDGFPSITIISGSNYLVNSKTVNFYKPFSTSTFDPDDY